MIEEQDIVGLKFGRLIVTTCLEEYEEVGLLKEHW